MLREFFCSGPWRRLTFAWVGLAIFVGHAVFKAWLKYALNLWYTEFYDALQDAGWSDPVEDLPSGEPKTLAAQYENMDAWTQQDRHYQEKRAQVWDLLVQFATIVAPAVVVHPLGRWISSWWRFSWRMALVRAYLVHYDVAQPPIEGAAQRIHEDTQRFEEGIYSCFAIVLDAVLTLLVFIPVLLEVGSQTVPHSMGDFDGWLVAISAGAALGGLFVSMVVGRKLVRLEVKNQIVEALLRTRLVLLEQAPAQIVGAVPIDEIDIRDDDSVVHADDECTVHAPRPPKPRRVSPMPMFGAVLSDLRYNYGRLFLNFAAFNTWISMYDQVMVLVPYMLVAPLMFSSSASERITLGTLMRVSNAFDKVFGAMAVVTENWVSVNDFRSTVIRLREFERATYTRKQFDHTLLRAPSPPKEHAGPRLAGDTELATAVMVVAAEEEANDSHSSPRSHHSRADLD